MFHTSFYLQNISQFYLLSNKKGGKMRIQLLTSFLSKYIHVGAVGTEFLPDVKNNPSNPHTQVTIYQDAFYCH